MSGNPADDARRMADAQAAATAEARKGAAHPDADMVAIKAIAGFELAEIFAEWARREDAERGTFQGPELDRCDGLGPPWRIFQRIGGALVFEWGETPEAFGERIAKGILKLLKEV